MANIFQRVMQLATLGAFLLAIAFVTSAFGSSTWRYDALGQILDSLKDVFSYAFYTAMAVSGYFPAIGIMSGANIGANMPLSEALLFPFLNMTYQLTDVSGNVIAYSSFNDLWDATGSPPIFTLFADQGLAMLSNFYFLLFILLFILAIVYILLFVGRSDIKYSIYTVTCLAGMLITASFPSLIKKILDLFGVPPEVSIPFFDSYFPEVTILNPNVVAGTATVRSLWAAFFVYACLELSFQAAYVSKVNEPSHRRARLLEEQMAILGERSLQLEVEKKEREVEQKAGAPAGSGQAAAEERARVTIRSFFTGAGLGAIREMVERRERERERTRLEEVSSDTRRLHGYITRLFEVDKRARDTLTAVGSAPSQKNMVTTMFLNMGFRLLALFALVFLVTNPQLLYAVFNVPPIIAESYEFYAPEAVVTALVPIAMLFPVISFAIRNYKQYRLTQFKAQREEQSAMLKRLSELREIDEAETVIADEGKKAELEQKPAGGTP
ncbi:MAG: hypothetical protein JW839_15415 [Candidatus Lokiarchaeota archaeon]|nr:hypothetical protein [Candidatus Lokiarchaeota archaeon]